MSTVDSTALRVALWRALHLQVDAAPPVLNDEIGLRLAAPAEGWQQRPDMHPEGTKGYRASIVGRSRLIEDLVLEKFAQGVSQYVILGAGLDSFAQRRPAQAAALQIFEVDQPGTQAWKQERLQELGLEIPSTLHFVPVNFEAGESWLQKLSTAGFQTQQPAVVASTGVSMYLTKEANLDTLRKIASMAAGTVLAMTFILPLDMLDPVERPQHEMVYERAKAAGTPFVSFFRPEEMLQMARAAGFSQAEHISREEIIRRYFAGRSDGLKPSSGEEFLIATV